MPEPTANDFPASSLNTDFRESRRFSDSPVSLRYSSKEMIPEMDTIEFTKEGVTLTEESFGGLDKSTLTIPYEELDKYRIELDISGEIGLDTLIVGDDSERAGLDFRKLPTCEVKITEEEKGEQTTKHRDDSEEIAEVQLNSRPESMPPVPEVSRFKTDTDERFYKRLKNNPDSQPAVYRRLIRNEEQIPRPKFDRWTARHGFDPSGGSHNASLLVLERVTDEIERRGRGDDQVLIWTGD